MQVCIKNSKIDVGLSRTLINKTQLEKSIIQSGKGKVNLFYEIVVEHNA